MGGFHCWNKQNDCEARDLEAVEGLEEGEGPKERENTLFTSAPERPEKQDLYAPSLGLKKRVPTRITRDGLEGGLWG